MYDNVLSHIRRTQHSEDQAMERQAMDHCDPNVFCAKPGNCYTVTFGIGVAAWPRPKRVGREAGKLLKTSKSKTVRSVAGSALRQERQTKPKKK